MGPDDRSAGAGSADDAPPAPPPRVHGSTTTTTTATSPAAVAQQASSSTDPSLVLSPALGIPPTLTASRTLPDPPTTSNDAHAPAPPTKDHVDLLPAVHPHSPLVLSGLFDSKEPLQPPETPEEVVSNANDVVPNVESSINAFSSVNGAQAATPQAARNPASLNRNSLSTAESSQTPATHTTLDHVSDTLSFATAAHTESKPSSPAPPRTVASSPDNVSSTDGTSFHKNTPFSTGMDQLPGTRSSHETNPNVTSEINTPNETGSDPTDVPKPPPRARPISQLAPARPTNFGSSSTENTPEPPRRVRPASMMAKPSATSTSTTTTASFIPSFLAKFAGPYKPTVDDTASNSTDARERSMSSMSLVSAHGDDDDDVSSLSEMEETANETIVGVEKSTPTSQNLAPNDSNGTGIINGTTGGKLYPTVNVIEPTPRSSITGQLGPRTRTGYVHSTSFENLDEIASSSTETDEKKDNDDKRSAMSIKTTFTEQNVLSPTQRDALERSTSIKIDVPGRLGAAPTRMEMFPYEIPNTPSRQTVGPNLERLRTAASGRSRLSKRESVLLHQQLNPPAAMPLLKKKNDFGIWYVTVLLLTFYIPTFCIKYCGGMHDKKVIRAWREKVALCTIFAILCAILGFITYGFNATLCPQRMSFKMEDIDEFNVTYAHSFIYRGNVYNFTKQMASHEGYSSFASGLDFNVVVDLTGENINSMFYTPSSPPPSCSGLITPPSTEVPCKIPIVDTAYAHCHTWSADYNNYYMGPVMYTWEEVRTSSTLAVFRGDVIDISLYTSVGSSFLGAWADTQIRAGAGKDISQVFSGTPNRVRIGNCLKDLYTVARVEYVTAGCFITKFVLYTSLIVILSAVLCKFFLAVYFSWFMSRKLGRLREQESARQAANSRSSNMHNTVDTFRRKQVLEMGLMPYPMKAGLVATDSSRAVRSRRRDGSAQRTSSAGEDDSDTSLTQSSAASDGFYAPITFNPLNGVHGGAHGITHQGTHGNGMRPTGPRQQPERAIAEDVEGERTDAESSIVGNNNADSNVTAVVSDTGVQQDASVPSTHSRSSSLSSLDRYPLRHSPYGLEVYSILLVTCYSEDEKGLKTTLDSLTNTNYSDDHKLIFVVADGMITGSGNSKSTPQIVIDMLELDPNWPTPPTPVSYLSLAEGSKHHNMAQVYIGWYNCNGRTVPTILVVKCGAPEERDQPKPGNRGKRDSQIILMSFFQKVTFDDLMSPLDYDLFQKMHYLMGVTPDNFEVILMVDADTTVAPDSLARMVASMVSDPLVMGLCGETRIANKNDSWVSRIQVYEYYLSHHQSKAFESVFGSVTCLPGCFCMYRIKAPLEGGYWVPILANPDIVKTYSENKVDTLHKKNLFLLGEDRFLTTLMLGTFPHRKLLFIPKAYCKTVVPNEFKVLLSQRRRWINSTVHNMFELILVNKLCGVFCFSLQGVLALELFGTVTLPAAISFTIVLIISSVVTKPVQIIPLVLLGVILLLPGFLILLTSKRRVYVYWMSVYLASLVVWNFVLPSYAYWHFDDFSWGATRKVDGELKGSSHDNDDTTENETYLAMISVPKKRWCDWETERRKRIFVDNERWKAGR